MKQICPYCSEILDANFSVEHGMHLQPADNDFSICVYCAEISMFCNNGKSLRKISDSDKFFIDENEESFNKVIEISTQLKLKHSALKVQRFERARMKFSL